MNQSQNKIYQYFERNPGLRILFIFAQPFLDAELAGAEWLPGYRYHVFSGDWFTTKFRLENDWRDEKVILYFNQASPLEDRSQRDKFPLMDLLAANMQYHAQDYAAFMQQWNLPQTMATFIDKNIQQLQSDKMIRMLRSYYEDGSINEDTGIRAFLSMYFGREHVENWDEIIVRILLQGRESERNKQVDFYKRLGASPYIKQALDRKLTDIFSRTVDYNSLTRVEKLVEVLKYNAMVQNLAPVSTDGYKTLRITDSVALQQQNRILELLNSQPKVAKAFNELLDETGKNIREEDIINSYGTEANYYYIPRALCWPILIELLKENVKAEPEKAIARVEELLVKHGDSADLGVVMDYTLLLAQYYKCASGIGSYTLKTADDYITKYETEYYLLDQLYRLTTEAFYKIGATSSFFDTIRSSKVLLDQDYAKLTNRINLEWLRCVSETGGMVMLHGLRQWNFYEDLVKPQQIKTAVIVSDALRFEVAQQLVGELIKTRHTAKLSTAIATLPTETKYAKPSLLPYDKLELYGNADGQDLNVDNSILNTIERRSTHLAVRKEGAKAVSFDTIAKYDSDKNREIFRSPLVYIFHDDIDTKGHDGNARDVVNGCSQAVADLADMVHKLHASYNVTEVYVTADHGFLFNDISFEDKDKHKIAEDALEKKSRYYLTYSDAEVAGVSKFPLGEVSGIMNAEGIYVAVPDGTNRFNAPSGGYMFAHGGASLQEMVIPVIISHRKDKEDKDFVGVTILGRNLSIQSSRLKFTLLQTEAVSMTNKERVITVAIYDGDAPVTAVKTLVLDKTDSSLDNRKIPVDLTLTGHTSSKVLQLRVYDSNDALNPLIKENVINNTLIETDFDF